MTFSPAGFYVSKATGHRMLSSISLIERQDMNPINLQNGRNRWSECSEQNIAELSGAKSK